MSNGGWNPWKATTIGLVISIAVALVAGLVVANWSGSGSSQTAVKENSNQATGTASSAVAQRPAVPGPQAQAPVNRAPAPKTVTSSPSVPSQAVVNACNQQAANQVGPRDKTMEVVKDGVIGAVGGAAVGAAGGAIAGGGKGAVTGAAIGGLVGAGGGTLYGLNENRRYEERYRDAYAACMRARGYFG